MYGVQFEGRLCRSGVTLAGSVKNLGGAEFKTDDPTEAKDLAEGVRQELERAGWENVKTWAVDIRYQEVMGVR